MAKVRNHNAQTRWNNSRHKGATWAFRTRENKSGEEETVAIQVPYDTLYDPDLAGYEGDNSWSPRRNMPEPFDALSLNWIEELVHWVLNNNLKLERQQTSRGSFLYTAVDNSGNVALTVESSHNVLFEPQSPKRRKRRKA